MLWPGRSFHLSPATQKRGYETAIVGFIEESEIGASIKKVRVSTHLPPIKLTHTGVCSIGLSRKIQWFACVLQSLDSQLVRGGMNRLVNIVDANYRFNFLVWCPNNDWAGSSCRSSICHCIQGYFISLPADPIANFPFEDRFFAHIAGHHTSTCKKQLKVPFHDHNCIIVILQKTSLPRTRAEIVRKFNSGFPSEYRKLFHKMSVLLCSQAGGPRVVSSP